MIKKIELNAKTRKNENENLKDIRKQGEIPAILYGLNKNNEKLLFKYNDFDKAYIKAGESSLIDLRIGDSEAIKVIVKDVQKDPVKDSIIHVDLYRVDMNKKIEVEIPFNFVGESKAIKELGGVLIKSMEVLQVSSLPGDLVDKIDVDLSKIESLNAGIKVLNIEIPDNLNLISSKDALIASVVEPKVVVEEEKTEKAESDEKDEKKEDGDKTAEGDKKEGGKEKGKKVKN